MDPLGAVLDSLQLRNTLYRRAEHYPPWGVTFQSSPLAVFHVITDGEGWLLFDDQTIHPPIHLHGGDMVMLAQGIAHEIKDDPASPIFIRLQITGDGEIVRESNEVRRGNEVNCTGLVCGGFYFERAETHPLLSLLPPVIHIRNHEGQTPDMMRMVLKLVASEASQAQPGNSTMLKRLMDILFIQVVRVWLENKPEQGGGWLNGLKDPQIGTALGLIHREAGRPWTVTELAGEVGLSRSLFSERFRRLVGESPGQYLTRWRMHLAATLFERDSSLTVTQVAARVSYTSETTFSKVFKRQFGLTPGTYRRSNQAAPRPSAVPA